MLKAKMSSHMTSVCTFATSSKATTIKLE